LAQPFANQSMVINHQYLQGKSSRAFYNGGYVCTPAPPH
jgi:hypothetical protein